MENAVTRLQDSGMVKDYGRFIPSTMYKNTSIKERYANNNSVLRLPFGVNEL